MRGRIGGFRGSRWQRPGQRNPEVPENARVVTALVRLYGAAETGPRRPAAGGPEAVREWV